MPTTIIVAVVVALVVAVITWIVATAYRKNVVESKIGSAEDKAREIIDEALKTAETKKREALLEAKAKGVVGHIGITAHLSQTFEKALKVDEIETIMFPYNIVEQQGKELIDRCAEKGKAFIDMKPLAGGAIEDGRLALRYVLSNPAVTVSIPGMAAPEELEQNVAGSANTAPLTPEEKAACQKVRDTLGTQFCRRCNYCAPCTVGIQIPSCFLFHGYLERYGLAGWTHERYDTLTVKAGACIGCGKCETRCPYNLPIRDMLKKVAQDFGE